MRTRKVESYLNKSYLILSVVPLFIIVVAVLLIFNNHMMNKIFATRIEQVDQVRKLMDMELTNVEHQTSVLLESNALLDLIDVTEESKLEVDNRVLIYKMTRDMDKVKIINQYIETIFIYNRDTDILFTSNGYAGLFNEFTNLGWNKIKTSPGTKWTYSYEKVPGKDELSLNLLMIKRTSPFIHRFKGELIVNMNEVNLLSYLDSLRSSEDVGLTVLDKEGFFLVSTTPSLNSELSDLELITEKQGYFIDYNNKHVHYYSRSENGWVYIQTNNYDSFQFALKGIIPVILVITLILLIAIFVASRLFTRKIYSPLDKILKNIISENEYPEDNEFDFIDGVIQNIQKKNTKMVKFLSNNRQMIKENIIKRLLLGRTNLNYIENQLEYINFARDKDLYFSIYIDLTFLQDDEMWPTWHKLVLTICESSNCDDYTCMGIGLDAGTIGLIVGTNDIDMALRASNQLIIMTKERLDRKIQLIHGSYVPALEDLSLSFSQAKELSRRNIFKNLNTILLYDESIDKEEDPYEQYPLEREARIISSLQAGDLDQALAHLNEFIHINGHVMERCILESNCIFLISQITREFSAWEHVVSENVIANFIKDDNYIDRIILWFKNFFTDIIAISDCYHDNVSRHKEIIEIYIKANFHKGITLETVADSVGISYSYLRKIFNGMFGCGFAYYLNVLRIEQVKLLLENTNKTVEAISQETGFSSMPSFHRNFKKITGFTPSGYRRHIKKEQILCEISPEF